MCACVRVCVWVCEVHVVCRGCCFPPSRLHGPECQNILRKKKKRKKEVFFLSQPVAVPFACMFANLVLGAFLTRSAKRFSPRGLERLGYVVFSLLLL